MNDVQQQENPREDIGANRPPLITLDQLRIDFSHLEEAVATAVQTADDVPSVIEDDEDVELARAAAKELIAQSKRAESVREDAKEPYLSAGRVVDSYFSRLKGRLGECQLKLNTNVTRYLAKKAAEEKARREAEERKAREEERKRREEALAAERAAAEARRKVEEEERAARQLAQQQASKEAEEASRQRAARAAAARAEAEKQEAEAQAARQRELDAQAASQAARKAVEEKPADMARTRTSAGVATLAQHWTFEILDFDTVDLESLRPYLTQAQIEAAIRRYVATHENRRALKGVRIYQTTKAMMA